MAAPTDWAETLGHRPYRFTKVDGDFVGLVRKDEHSEVWVFSVTRDGITLVQGSRSGMQQAFYMADQSLARLARPSPIDKLSIESIDELHLLQEALAEFMAARGPTVDSYVERRYPPHKGYSEAFRVEKRANVRKRLALAEEMRDRLFKRTF